jgi:hypothetical protein
VGFSGSVANRPIPSETAREIRIRSAGDGTGGGRHQIENVKFTAQFRRPRQGANLSESTGETRAERQGAIVPQMIGHRLLGTSWLLTGTIAEGQAHLDRALTLYDPLEHRQLATRFGHDDLVAAGHRFAALSATSRSLAATAARAAAMSTRRIESLSLRSRGVRNPEHASPSIRRTPILE